MYYLYLCICTSAKCMSVELKVYLFIWSHNFRFSMSLSLSPNSLYRQTTDCTTGGGLTREHCILYIFHVWDRQINIDIGTQLEQNCSYECLPFRIVFGWIQIQRMLLEPYILSERLKFKNIFSECSWRMYCYIIWIFL